MMLKSGDIVLETVPTSGNKYIWEIIEPIKYCMYKAKELHRIIVSEEQARCRFNKEKEKYIREDCCILLTKEQVYAELL